MEMDDLIHLADVLGITPDEVRERLADALSTQRHTAMESDSDPDVPADVYGLAMLCEAATGQRITAVKRGHSTSTVPNRDLPPNMSELDWHQMRLFGLPRKLTANDPQPMSVRRDGWNLYTPDNPITIEGWLRQQGLYASAGCPWVCFVEWRAEK